MSEYENIKPLDKDLEKKIDDIYFDNPSEFTKLRRKYLKEGLSYIEAFNKAADEVNKKSD